MLRKILGILLISLLLIAFVLGAVIEVASKYINLLVPFVLLGAIALAIVFYYSGRSKEFKSA
jgi:1,4-dihydroxy-2-naphthoate octaprenyltransferase